MILVDTSVWIDHLRKSPSNLTPLLDNGLALIHPFIIGELACGSLRNRARILSDLQALPSAAMATADEVLRLIETRSLWGMGIGWIDAHLLASALISNCQFWTLDARLARAASAAGVGRFPEVKP
jgi:predicted nucleic acid-binding protein